MQATIRIKGYDGIEQLALGKRAVAFKARSRKHKMPVVIKVLLPHLAGDRRFMARFKRDVAIAAGTRHENLVNVLEFGAAESSHFVVVEHHDGLTLEEILAEHPRVPTPIALSIVLGLSRGLQALHARDLVHRDVRPANIVITNDGQVKLANAGLATDIGESGRVTHAGKVTATPAFMSPEQTRGETLTRRSDIFSLGAVAFQLLAGKRAFGRGDFGAIVDRIQRHEVAPIRSLNPLIEAPIEQILETAMRAEASQRYQHVSELLMDLEEAMEKYGYESEPEALATYVADPAGFAGDYDEALLERLAARAPMRDNAKAGNTATLIRYYEKVCFLDPGDEGAKHELERLRRERGSATPATDRAEARYANLDQTAQYRVVLESFDTSRENAASFALKLSMKLRLPLPRASQLVRCAPSRLAEGLAYDKAIRLARAIESLGGSVRLDVCSEKQPEDKPAPAKTASGKDGRTCGSCGWVEDLDAGFCSMCHEPFDSRKTREQAAGEENPLGDEHVRLEGDGGLLAWVADLPWKVKVVGGAIIVVLFALAILR